MWGMEFCHLTLTYGLPLWIAVVWLLVNTLIDGMISIVAYILHR
jgi:hypothetical protein